MAVLYRVKALYEYSSPHDDDLNFPAGQIIAVTEEEDDDWYTGEYLDNNGSKKEGIFPRNFVEKYEPVAPPRPMRKQKHEHEALAPPPQESSAPEEAVAQNVPPPPAAAQEEAASAPEPEPAAEEAHEPVKQSPPTEPPVHVPAPAAVPAPVPAPAQIPAASTVPIPAPAPHKQAEAPAPAAPAASASKPKPAPPPVSEKPSSFKDRIAAFNKPAAAPIAPFKPSSLTGGGGVGGSSGFIKKPFVAPPPSRNAYVPPPRESPATKVYRRDEDPEIHDRVAENIGQAERAGLIPSEAQPQNDEEDQPKPTSLKERIALLQKQQMEQAQRHAESAAKKEKPKKPPPPPKKKAEAPAPSEAVEGAEDLVSAPSLERRNTEEAGARTSIDQASSAPIPPLPRRQTGVKEEKEEEGGEVPAQGDSQDDTAQDEDNEKTPRNLTRIPTASSAVTGGVAESAAGLEGEEEEEEEEAKAEEEAGEEGEDEEEEEEEEEEVDPEVKRKEELRARMAKMSGGMGFHGMFGAPVPSFGGGGASKKKAAKPPSRQSITEEEDSAPPPRAPPVPIMMALPGMGLPKKTTEEAPRPSEDEHDEADNAEEEEEEAATPAALPEKTEAPPEPRAVPAPPVPKEDPTPPPPPVAARPPPPPVPTAARPPPPPVPAGVKSATEGSESDDELSSGARENTGSETAHALRSPPLPPVLPTTLPPRSPPQSPIHEFLPTSPGSKRASRPPPPVPGSAPVPPPAQSRPPPPPPPGGLSRQSTADVGNLSPIRPPQAGETAGENTEYEGDYDTDMGSFALHKDALTKDDRESSFEDNSILSPTDAPEDIPPPPPPPTHSVSTPRAAPPPVPMSPEASRRSTDLSRSVPTLPPPIPPKQAQPAQEDNYDHSYIAAPTILTSSTTQESPQNEPSSYFPDSSLARSPPERRIPPIVGRSRASIDGNRNSLNIRRSIDQNRPSMESGFISGEIDLAVQSGWWKQSNQLPPVLQGRKDLYFECDESTGTDEGNKTVVTRETFVLFQDYSQTIITARYDPYDPSNVQLEQRHEGPPRALRQDQMEEAYDNFGRQISASAAARKDQVVADGTSQGFVIEMLRPLTDALAPISTRSYGALVYSNMANASTQQHDVIRPGDVITIRNAKFQGKHGPMHAKYSMDVGKPDHVGIVAEWDGTKKKVRAWEQGRDSKKVKQESYKLDDLRSGEVKIWRVVARSWVGWQRKLQ